MTTLDDVRLRLVAERDRAGSRLAQLRGDFADIVAASQQTNADDEHDPEGATIAFERSQVDALVRQAACRLGEIERALERLEAGEHDRCFRCGGAIAAARLDARPGTTTCIACARLG